MVCLQVPASDIERQWQHMLRLLAPAIERSNGRWTPDDVFNEAEAGRLQIWVLIEDQLLYGVGVTEIQSYPGLKCCSCLWLGGVDAYRWLHLLDDTVSAWAIDEGCSRMEIIGRKGWEKLGSQLGFKPSYVFFEKKLETKNRGPGQNAGDIEADHFDGASPVVAGSISGADRDRAAATESAS